jgi:hypothetical protein
LKKCIYCLKEKEDGEFSLEHIIPKFLGGTYAPDYLKTRNVCKKCNNDLGIFVDAAFQKSWLIYQEMRSHYLNLFDRENPCSLPLLCMGNSRDINPPEMTNNEICENYIGPLGESIFLIRRKDENLDWYLEGNPIASRKYESRAYFFFSIRSEKEMNLSLFAFKNAFKNRKIKKILCTTFRGFDLTKIGFSSPDELDQKRIDYLNEKILVEDCSLSVEFSLYENFDFRFLAKLGIGLSHALFGEKVSNDEYHKLMIEAIWHRDTENFPKIKGTSIFNSINDDVRLFGIKNTITLMIMQDKQDIALNLNIGTKLNSVTKIASKNALTPDDLEKIGEGIVIILCKPMKIGIEIKFREYIQYKCGHINHPELDRIAQRMAKNE